MKISGRGGRYQDWEKISGLGGRYLRVHSYLPLPGQGFSVVIAFYMSSSSSENPLFAYCLEGLLLSSAGGFVWKCAGLLS